jgi:membrane protein implicated in regulation of membrane protease activity
MDPLPELASQTDVVLLLKWIIGVAGGLLAVMGSIWIWLLKWMMRKVDEWQKEGIESDRRVSEALGTVAAAITEIRVEVARRDRDAPRE